MKLAISNIAWTEESDEVMYKKLKEWGIEGLEIAPTRIIKENPYDHIQEAGKWYETVAAPMKLAIPSMQSIWYGRGENMFADEKQRAFLLDYTKKAVDFAQAIHCKNLVFGCPKGRNIPEGKSSEPALAFFKELGDYAASKGRVIGLEANPTLYGTNFCNTTKEVLDWIEKVNSPGLLLNLDMGTVVYNEEDLQVLVGKGALISHVHISEPGLKAVEERPIHRTLYELLAAENYQNYVSIEMGNSVSLEEIGHVVRYVKKGFGY